MKSRLFFGLRESLALFESGGSSDSTIARQLNELFAEITADFSYASFELFELYRNRAEAVGGESMAANVRSFINDDFLETSFAKDPSDYGVVLALGVKQLRLGNPSRAQQLIRRVAKSGYKERAQAEILLRKHFPDVQA
jgi:hypothetical protein